MKAADVYFDMFILFNLSEIKFVVKMAFTPRYCYRHLPAKKSIFVGLQYCVHNVLHVRVLYEVSRLKQNKGKAMETGKEKKTGAAIRKTARQRKNWESGETGSGTLETSDLKFFRDIRSSEGVVIHN